MRIKKLLLGSSLILGFIVADGVFAKKPDGAGAKIKTAQIACTGTLTGDVPLHTIAGAGQQKGIETSWLITNTDNALPLLITRIDSYGMDGSVLTSLTPTANPELETETAGLFAWTVNPRQLVRFPHDYSMVYTAEGVGVTDPSLVKWYHVIFTVQSGAGKPISAPTVVAAMVERTEDLNATPPTHFVLSRTRNECRYL